jgi:uroporphyrin-III C-methyltransferase/precorrin-2 dehydrogenase/sirohydrochlorin ferrochelatase
MPYTSYHPVYLHLTGRRVVIVGGGTVAIEKLNSLIPTGAEITVVSPEILPEVQTWVTEGTIQWKARVFEPADINDAFMVIAATDDPDLNHWVYSLGNAAQKLSNSVDDPVNCNFIMAAIARSGPMQVAISSAGCSPALAQRVRNRIVSEILTENVGALAEFLGDRRPEVKATLPSYKIRQKFWEQVIDSKVPHILSSQGEEAAEAEFRSMLRRAALASTEPQSVDAQKVYIVGAGPGDPGLLTVRAAEILRRADVILYDRLVNPILLGYAPPGAECIYVGKDRGTPRRGRQGSINDQLIAHAHRGKIVVRLKGGDPFVFGRGGEEMLALAQAGIAFEVVPGISSAVAAAEAAQIPVTHRGVSAAFAVFAGQEAEDSEGDRIPWEAAATIPTAVFLMGVERLPLIVSRLIEHGRSPSTPVAIVSNGTLPTQRVVVGTLETILSSAGGSLPPAVIVVGDVVLVRQRVEEFANQFSHVAA